MRAWNLALVAALLLAGCAGTSPLTGTNGPLVPDPSDPNGLPATEKPYEAIWADARAALAATPCEATYAGTDVNTANLVQLSGIAIPDSLDGIHAELDVAGGLAIHARYGSSGFELYDIRDPLAPKHLGNWTMMDEAGEPVNDGALDVKFSPDNKTVLVGAGDGIHLVDVRDPLNPTFLGHWSASEASPLGATVPGAVPVIGGTNTATPLYNPHMLYTKRIAGADWVFLAPNANSGIWILKMEGNASAPRLTYVTQTLPVEGGPIGPHDMWVGTDEMTGDEYLYSADGFHGWTVFNVNDPANPTPVGAWVNPAEGGYTHTIQAQEINGKRIVVTIAEVGANFVRVYDASVIQAPVMLAQWQASPDPGHGALPSALSPEHNLNIVDGKLYFAYYRFGMMVFDLAELAALPAPVPLVQSATMTPIAHFGVPGAEQAAAPGDLGFTGFWDVVLKDGVIYVSHIEGGLIVLGFGCQKDLPRPELTSTG